MVTGAAGFIGAALIVRLLDEGENVIGVDNLNDYYDPELKKSRLREITLKQKKSSGKFHFFEANLEDFNDMKIFLLNLDQKLFLILQHKLVLGFLLKILQFTLNQIF